MFCVIFNKIESLRRADCMLSSNTLTCDKESTFRLKACALSLVAVSIFFSDLFLQAIRNEQNEIMWYFLDSEIPTGKLSIIALKQGSVTPTPVLFQKETSKQTWTTSNTIDSTTSELPLAMSLPSSGLWLLNIYVNEKYYDQFVITAE